MTRYHEMTPRSHDTTSRNHDMTSRGHDMTSRSHEMTSRSHDMGIRSPVGDYGYNNTLPLSSIDLEPLTGVFLLVVRIQVSVTLTYAVIDNFAS